MTMDTPTKPTAKRKTKNDWVPRFLAVFSDTGQIDHSCEAAGINRWTFYNRRNTDPAFAEQVKAAHEESLDRLEAIARRRAAESSDTLLIFLLKANRPEKYRERQEIRHAGGVDLHHSFDLTRLTDGQLAQLETLVRAASTEPSTDRA